MVRSKLRRFGSLALILVLLSALIVPTFIVSPSAITAEEFEEYCRYGVFADCSVSMTVTYADAVGDISQITRSSIAPDLIRGGLYFATYWNLFREDLGPEHGDPLYIDIDIFFAVPFSYSQEVAKFKVSGFTSSVDIYGSFYTEDDFIIGCYPISSSSDGSPQYIEPKFVFPAEANKMINRLRLSLEIDSVGAMTTCNTLFTTEHFCVFSQINNLGGYSAGYDQGYDVGYDEAAELVRQLYRDEYNRGYSNGYNAGATSSQTAAKDEGYRTGLTEGYNEGFREGKVEGIMEGDHNLSFASLFFSLFDAPVKVLSGLFDFNFLGMNMFQFGCSVVTLLLFVWLLKVLFL